MIEKPPLDEIEPIDSPCQLICSMDRESGHCFGCGRTTDEIAYWTLKNQTERDNVLALLPARMPPLREKLEERRTRRRVNKRKKSTLSSNVETPNTETPDTESSNEAS